MKVKVKVKVRLLRGHGRFLKVPLAGWSQKVVSAYAGALACEDRKVRGWLEIINTQAGVPVLSLQVLGAESLVPSDQFKKGHGCCD